MNDITIWDQVLSLAHQYENAVTDATFNGFTLWLIRRKAQYVTQSQDDLKKKILFGAQQEIKNLRQARLKK